ncbi:MAG: hypothetical protein EON93_09345, partial [Burkholderiales bacterium]
VAYLEMVRAAVEKALPHSPDSTNSKAPTIIELHNTAWIQPVVVDNDKQITIALFANDSDGHSHERVDYEIYSHNNDAEDPFEEIVHCQGQAVVTRRPAPASINIDALKNQMRQDELQSTDLYSVFNSIGLNYGPAHQGIAALYIGDNQVLAELRLDIPRAAERIHLGDHVGHLPRQAGNVQRCAVHNLDPHDAVCRDPAQRRLRVVRFSRHAPAVDEHVLLGLAKATLIAVIVADREAGNVPHHVHGRLRRKPREVGRLIDLRLPRCVRARCGGVDRLHLNRLLLLRKGGSGSGHTQGGRDRKNARCEFERRTPACAASACVTCRQTRLLTLTVSYGDAGSFRQEQRLV